MLTDEELKPFLSGEKGVDGLDLGRELVATRSLLQALSSRCEELERRCQILGETAESSILACAEAEGKLRALCSRLAELCAEHLGTTA